MLRRYNDKIEDIFLETDKDYFTVDLQGNLFHVEKGIVPKVTQVIAYYKGDELFVDIKSKSVRLANIINFVFKNGNPDFFWEIMDWDIIYIDGNKLNLFPFNLSWNNTNIKDDEEGFRLIPGYTRYKINKNGIVKRIKDDLVQKNYYYKAKRVKKPYTNCSIKPDYNGKTITQSIHRLLAYSYLPIPNNYFALDVSHLDCNPENNNLDNLEWQSRRENNLQTTKQLLTNFQQPCLAMDVETKTIREFFSLREMERGLGLSKGLAELRILSRGKVKYSDGKAYMLKSDFKGTWPTVEHNGKLPSIVHKVTVTYKKENRTITLDSVEKLTNILKVSSSGWRWRLRRFPFKWEDENIIVEKIV